VNHFEYMPEGTDGRTADRCFTLTVRHGQHIATLYNIFVPTVAAVGQCEFRLAVVEGDAL